MNEANTTSFEEGAAQLVGSLLNQEGSVQLDSMVDQEGSVQLDSIMDSGSVQLMEDQVNQSMTLDEFLYTFLGQFRYHQST